jgi:hypothetical protein
MNHQLNQHLYKNKLPVNSPNNDRQFDENAANGIVCYYSPVNVNGSNNIVNTNF